MGYPLPVPQYPLQHYPLVVNQAPIPAPAPAPVPIQEHYRVQQPAPEPPRQQVAYEAYRAPPPRQSREEPELVDQVNKFFNRSSSRPHAADLETFGTYFNRDSPKAQARSDIESAFGRSLRGNNIFEPRFVI